MPPTRLESNLGIINCRRESCMKIDETSPSMHIIKKLAKLRVSEIAIEKIERLATKLGIDEDQLLHLYLEAKNNVHRERFNRVPYSDRILFLPQCLRSKECIAKLSEFGYKCAKCGKCEIKKIIGFAKKIGYRKVFIVSGGSMAKKILSLERPKACVGIACNRELILGSFICEKFNIILQGISLLRDGCTETVVDSESLLNTLQRKS